MDEKKTLLTHLAKTSPATYVTSQVNNRPEHKEKNEQFMHKVEAARAIVEKKIAKFTQQNEKMKEAARAVVEQKIGKQVIDPINESSKESDKSTTESETSDKRSTLKISREKLAKRFGLTGKAKAVIPGQTNPVIQKPAKPVIPIKLAWNKKINHLANFMDNSDEDAIIEVTPKTEEEEDIKPVLVDLTCDSGNTETKKRRRSTKEAVTNNEEMLQKLRKSSTEERAAKRHRRSTRSRSKSKRLKSPSRDRRRSRSRTRDHRRRSRSRSRRRRSRSRRKSRSRSRRQSRSKSRSRSRHRLEEKKRAEAEIKAESERRRVERERRHAEEKSRQRLAVERAQRNRELNVESDRLAAIDQELQNKWLIEAQKQSWRCVFSQFEAPPLQSASVEIAAMPPARTPMVAAPQAHVTPAPPVQIVDVIPQPFQQVEIEESISVTMIKKAPKDKKALQAERAARMKREFLRRSGLLPPEEESVESTPSTGSLVNNSDETEESVVVMKKGPKDKKALQAEKAARMKREFFRRSGILPPEEMSNSMLSTGENTIPGSVGASLTSQESVVSKDSTPKPDHPSEESSFHSTSFVNNSVPGINGSASTNSQPSTEQHKSWDNQQNPYDDKLSESWNELFGDTQTAKSTSQSLPTTVNTRDSLEQLSSVKPNCSASDGQQAPDNGVPPVNMQQWNQQNAAEAENIHAAIARMVSHGSVKGCGDLDPIQQLVRKKARQQLYAENVEGYSLTTTSKRQLQSMAEDATAEAVSAAEMMGIPLDSPLLQLPADFKSRGAEERLQLRRERRAKFDKSLVKDNPNYIPVRLLPSAIKRPVAEAVKTAETVGIPLDSPLVNLPADYKFNKKKYAEPAAKKPKQSAETPEANETLKALEALGIPLDSPLLQGPSACKPSQSKPKETKEEQRRREIKERKEALQRERMEAIDKTHPDNSKNIRQELEEKKIIEEKKRLKKIGDEVGLKQLFPRSIQKTKSLKMEGSHWICPKCTKGNSEKRKTCFDCSAPMPACVKESKIGGSSKGKRATKSARRSYEISPVRSPKRSSDRKSEIDRVVEKRLGPKPDKCTRNRNWKSEQARKLKERLTLKGLKPACYKGLSSVEISEKRNQWQIQQKKKIEAEQKQQKEKQQMEGVEKNDESLDVVKETTLVSINKMTTNEGDSSSDSEEEIIDISDETDEKNKSFPDRKRLTNSEYKALKKDRMKEMKVKYCKDLGKPGRQMEWWTPELNEMALLQRRLKKAYAFWPCEETRKLKNKVYVDYRVLKRRTLMAYFSKQMAEEEKYAAKK